MVRSILVADDDETFILVLKALLVERGYVVEATATGNKLLERAGEIAPDAIVLNTSLPDDGHRLCQLLRAQPETADVPIVMTSARSRPIEIEKGLALGADATLVKPFTASELERVLHAAAAHRVRAPERAHG